MADDASQTPPAFDGEEANALLPVPARRLLRSGAVDGAAEGARSLAAPGLVLVCDILGRVIRAPYEIPVGTVASVVGAVVFIALILRTRRGAR